MKDEVSRLRQPVKVVSVAPGKLWVESLPKDGCARCAAGKGCGGGIFVKLFGRKIYRLPVQTELEVPVGSIVYLVVPIDRIHRAAMALYFWPLIMALCGALIGRYVVGSEGELVSIVLATVGFIGTLFFNKFRFGLLHWAEFYRPEIELATQDEVVCNWPGKARDTNWRYGGKS